MPIARLRSSKGIWAAEMTYIAGPAPEGKVVAGYKVVWAKWGKARERLFRPERGKGSPLDRAIAFSRRLPLGSGAAVLPVLKDLAVAGASK